MGVDGYRGLGSKRGSMSATVRFWGAIDLKFRCLEVQAWLAGSPVYDEIDHGVYPPATYALLWPFLGWGDFPVTRWFWAFTSLVACGKKAG